MPDIIIHDMTIDDFAEYDNGGVGYLIGTGRVDEIDEQPTVDAVPVVRCKDCKYTTIDNDVVRRNCGLHLVVNLNDDDFCSRGERKEDESGRD